MEAATLDPLDPAGIHAWMEQRFDVWRIEDANRGPSGTLTGYFEPQFEARRLADDGFRHPVFAPPPDLARRKPYWTRQEMESIKAVEGQMRPLALAFLRSPIDVLVMQVQGSGRLTITEADGSRREVRLRFAAHNDHPYQSVPRVLLDRGWISPAQANWSSIREWASRNPSRAQEAVWSNPRVVFFREESLDRPDVGPPGAIGIPLTPERSVAVDPRSIPLGTPLWMMAGEGQSSDRLQRWVIAQDTGTAITGAVRADYFWGWGTRAERLANRTRMPLRLWALWPKGATPPP
jgi:membrane-bound lytic murein transglycosylase A